MSTPTSTRTSVPADTATAEDVALRVDAQDVRFTYPDGTAALHGVGLTVAPGEVVAVLGRSGAGKSTLMRCLAGLDRPTSGRVLRDGVDLASLRGREARQQAARTGLVFQEFQLIGRATVLSNVLVGRLVHQPLLPSLVHRVRYADRVTAATMIAQVGLADLARKRADALSGGQRQRVALARALAQEPDLLLADEPVANLDPRLAQAVVHDIAEAVRSRGLTTVLNLHDVRLARQVAGRLVGLRAGRVVWDLPADRVDDGHLEALYAQEADG